MQESMSENQSMTTVDDCHIIKIDHHPNRLGTLTVAQNAGDLPFDIRRVYYIYDIPSGSERGGHAHIEQESLIMAVGGSFDVMVSDGVQTKKITLNRPYEGLYIPQGIWRSIDNFSSGSIVLVLASNDYCEDDYIRSYDDFVASKTQID